MAEKNLPIKFFEKRQKDEQETEGGGGGKLPEWVIKTPAEIRQKSFYFRTALESVSTSLTEKVKRNSQEVYKKETLPVASYYTKAKKVASINGMGDVDDIFARLSAIIDRKMK